LTLEVTVWDGLLRGTSGGGVKPNPPCRRLEQIDDVRLQTELDDEAARARLRDVQHLLCALVETLDPKRVRYTRDLERA
jgi:hypothetical protein